MEVSEKEIMRVIEPFLLKTGSVYYLPEDKVDDAIDCLYEEFENIYTEVKEYGKGVQRLIVGKLIKTQMRKKIEILIH